MNSHIYFNKNLPLFKIINLAQNNNQEAIEFIIKKFKYIIHFYAKKYYLPHSSYEDLLQEGYIGLYKAIKDYDHNENNTFKTFAYMCVKRNIISSIKRENRKKHKIFNESTSLNKSLFVNSKVNLFDIIENNKSNNPEYHFIKDEEINNLLKYLNNELSDLEYNCLILYLKDYSYKEIAKKTKIHLKAVTNAMYRVRKKTKKYKEYNCINSF